ncbi:hypothetical protein J437_LFUL004191 [Ladona fulva]|uniref:Uncharacterized protein n=1 Tax=Ladona fulva TaxID=123851 RepID=A0A8K0NV07_LADFU|nr:hypothetical protein J437_LFUL004191 [Ladona fulva]
MKMNETSIKTLCRICLSNSYLYSNIYVGQSTDSDPIYEVINYVYDLEISVDDGLPEYVCQECLAIVRDFKIYKANAHKAKSELILLKEKMENVFVKQEEGKGEYFDGKPNDEEIPSFDHEKISDNQVFIKEEKDSVSSNSDNDIVSSGYHGNIMEPETCIREVTSEEDYQLNTEFQSMIHNHEKVIMAEEEMLQERPKRLRRCREVNQQQCKRLQMSSEVYDGVRLTGDYSLNDSNLSVGGESISESSEKTSKDRVPRSRKCSVCGLRFNKLSELSKHQMTHRDEMPYECAVCKKRFREKGKMNKHQQVHERIKFECEQCGMKFLEEATLTKHQMMHKGKKTYPCTECGKVFTKQCHLNTHQMMHRGERPFECRQCGKHFREKSKLNKHELIHTGERAFACEECGKRFTYKYNLDAHKVVHLEEKPFGCVQCGKRFAFKKYLIRHQVVHAGDKQHLLC